MRSPSRCVGALALMQAHSDPHAYAHAALVRALPQVALGAEPDGKTSRVKIVGSSCERTQAIQATDVQKSEDEQRGVTVDATTAVALQMAQ